MRTFTNPETGSVFKVEEINGMIEAIIETGRGLNDWENQFMESVSDQFNRTTSISVPQLVSLERIYATKTP